jgi:mono/diheme cytochrome c family protein
MKRNNYISIFVTALTGVLLSGCGAGGEDTGLEYAPNMYHSVPYDPLTQITNPEAGEAAEFLNENEGDEFGEYYNSNPLNGPSEMTMRMPAPNTVRRSGFLPYRIPKDSLTLASAEENPYPADAEVIANGKVLYERFCDHCHGGDGQGPAPGSVGEVFAGVPSYTSAAVKDVSGGHIFHVITHGKGRMGPHQSMISVEDRWKIVRYVQTLQQN